jgi:hypothetical protein
MRTLQRAVPGDNPASNIPLSGKRGNKKAFPKLQFLGNAPDSGHKKDRLNQESKPPVVAGHALEAYRVYSDLGGEL